MVSSDMLGSRVKGVKAEKGNIRSFEMVIRNVRNMVVFATLVAFKGPASIQCQVYYSKLMVTEL